MTALTNAVPQPLERLDNRCALAATFAEHAATVDRMLRELLAARERLLQVRRTMASATDKVRQLGRGASESGIIPIELPASIEAFETIQCDMSRMELTIDTGLASVVRDLSSVSVTLRCVMGKLVAEPLASEEA
jgi:hypothetical protein